jgi:hypothetical protein
MRPRRIGPLPAWRVASLLLALGTLVIAPAGPAAGQPAARELPDVGGPLEPGRYHTTALGPRLSFEVGDSWRLVTPVAGPIVVLERVDVPDGVLTITRFDGDVFTDPCDPSSLTWVEPSAERLMEIIAGEPRLSAGEPLAVDVGGLPALDLEVSTPPLEDCRLHYLLLWALPFDGGEFVQVPGQQARIIALDVGPDVLVVAVETLVEEPFGFFASAAMAVVGSLRIDAAGASPPMTTPSPTGEVSADA